MPSDSFFDTNVCFCLHPLQGERVDTKAKDQKGALLSNFGTLLQGNIVRVNEDRFD